MRSFLIAFANHKVCGVVIKRYNKNTEQKEWALVSRGIDPRTGKRKVLYWFGKKKPNEAEIMKQEKRIQYFKHQ